LIVGLEIGEIGEDPSHLGERTSGDRHEVIDAHRSAACRVPTIAAVDGITKVLPS
jgi:enoyl-CoA hydratase/carnithine racemase